jgi:cytidine deaminase
MQNEDMETSRDSSLKSYAKSQKTKAFPIAELPEDIRKMVRLARRRRRNAYAPYSNYRVGCALRDERGKIYSGANVESVCTNLGVCAERAAVARLAALGGKKLKVIVVAASSAEPALPCGACRQVLAEFGLDAVVYAVDKKGEVCVRSTLKELLPSAYSSLE